MSRQPVIIQYWHEREPPSYLAGRLASFHLHNPQMRHRVFSESTAESLIGEYFGARHVAAFRACGPPAMQADYFRYCAVYALGGVYADADSLCMAGVAPLMEPAGHLFQSGWHLTNHVFAFKEPGHPLLELAIEVVTRGVEDRATEDVTLVTGPGVFTTLVKIAKLGSADAFAQVLHSVIERRVNQDGVDPIGFRRWLLHVEALRPLLGDHERITESCRNVRVSRREELESVISHSGGELPYRETGDHFPNWEASIFQTPSSS